MVAGVGEEEAEEEVEAEEDGGGGVVGEVEGHEDHYEGVEEG